MKKIHEYRIFIDWSATPSDLRKPATQKELAKKLKVDAATLSDWKQQDSFNDDVREQLQVWGHGKTPDVIQALYKNATSTGNPSAVKLWLETFEPNLYIPNSQKQLTISEQPPIALVKFIGDDGELTDHPNFERKSVEAEPLVQESA